MSNLILWSIAFLSVASGLVINIVLRFIFNIDPGVGNTVQEFFIFSGYVFFMAFTNATFYKNHMKTGNILFVVVVLLGLNQLILINIFGQIEIERGFEYYLRITLDIPYTFITFDWLAWSCYSSFKRLKDKDIEPWIKKRYQFIALASFIFSFHNIPEFFQPKDVRWGSSSDPTSLIIFGTMTTMMMIYAIIISLSWFMPKRLKAHFNKGYLKIEDHELSEEELIRLLRKEIHGT